MMGVRRATPADRDAVHRVHVESILGLGRTHYDDDQIGAWAMAPRPERYDLASDREPFFVVPRGGRLAGIAQVDLDRKHFEKLYVHPDHARSGIATALVERVESAAREDDVNGLTLVASLNAVPFYERVGYEGREATVKTLRTSGGEILEFPCLSMEKQL